jgi:hypothetical protein
MQAVAGQSIAWKGLVAHSAQERLTKVGKKVLEGRERKRFYYYVLK